MQNTLAYLFGYLVDNYNDIKIKLSVNSNDNIINSGLVIILLTDGKIDNGYFVENGIEAIKFERDNFILNDKKMNYDNLDLKFEGNDIFLYVSLLKIPITYYIKKYNIINDDNLSIDDLIVQRNSLFIRYKDNFIYELDLMDNSIIFDRKYNRFVIYDMGFKNKVDLKNVDIVVKYNINVDKKLESIIYLEHTSLNYTSILAYRKVDI